MSYTKVDLTTRVFPSEYAGYPVPKDAVEMIVEAEEVSFSSMTDGSYLTKYPTGATIVKYLDGRGDLVLSFSVGPDGMYIPATVTIPHKPSYRYSSTPPPPSTPPARPLIVPPASVLNPGESMMIKEWRNNFYRYILVCPTSDKFDHVILIHKDAGIDKKEAILIRDTLNKTASYGLGGPGISRTRVNITERTYLDVISGETTLDIIYKGGYDDFKASLGL